MGRSCLLVTRLQYITAITSPKWHFRYVVSASGGTPEPAMIITFSFPTFLRSLDYIVHFTPVGVQLIVKLTRRLYVVLVGLFVDTAVSVGPHSRTSYFA